MSIELPPTVRAEPPVVSSARLSAAVHDGERLHALDAEGLLDGAPRADLRPLRAARRARRRGTDRARLRRDRRAPVLRRPVRHRAAVGRRAPDAAVALLLPARRGQRRAARDRGRARGPGAVLEPRDPRPRRHRLRRLSDLSRRPGTSSAACARSTPRRATWQTDAPRGARRHRRARRQRAPAPRARPAPGDRRPHRRAHRHGQPPRLGRRSCPARCAAPSASGTR